jgi:hypothetical protein
MPRLTGPGRGARRRCRPCSMPTWGRRARESPHRQISHGEKDCHGHICPKQGTVWEARTRRLYHCSRERAVMKCMIKRSNGMGTAIIRHLSGIPAQVRHMRWVIWSLIIWR